MGPAYGSSVDVPAFLEREGDPSKIPFQHNDEDRLIVISLLFQYPGSLDASESC